MCFSAAASFTTGTILSAAGSVTLKQVKEKKELPLGLVPLLFGVQQIIEGLVWLSFGNAAFNTVATYAYTFFSHILWPIFIPICVLLLEKNKTRRKILQFFVGLGLIVGFVLLYFILANGVSSTIVQNSISYKVSYPYLPFESIFYLLATCGSSFFSSHKTVNFLGIAGIISAFISYQFYIQTFTSVWCFFAAILSGLIFLHFRKKKKVA